MSRKQKGRSMWRPFLSQFSERSYLLFDLLKRVKPRFCHDLARVAVVAFPSLFDVLGNRFPDDRGAVALPVALVFNNGVDPHEQSGRDANRDLVHRVAAWRAAGAALDPQFFDVHGCDLLCAIIRHPK
jgi:hypothetical protein